MGLNWRGFFVSLLTGEASAPNMAQSESPALPQPAANIPIANQPDLKWEDVYGDTVGSLPSTDVTKIRMFSEDGDFI